MVDVNFNVHLASGQDTALQDVAPHNSVAKWLPKQSVQNEWLQGKRRALVWLLESSQSSKSS